MLPIVRTGKVTSMSHRVRIARCKPQVLTEMSSFLLRKGMISMISTPKDDFFLSPLSPLLIFFVEYL